MNFVQSIKHIPQLVLFKQSFFGLPWVVVGALFPLFDEQISKNFHLDFMKFLYLFCVFFSARFCGMCLNRLIDERIDAKNPRTQNRLLQQGAVSSLEVLVWSILFLCLFFYFAFQLNTSCFFASCIAALLIVAYSFTKRFTTSCHFILGLIQFFAPVCAYLAMTETLTLSVCLLGCSLLASIAASDIVYACQDVAFDRKEGLWSVPAKLGIASAITFSKVLHSISFGLLIVLGCMLHLSWVYFLAVGAIGAIFFTGYFRLMQAEKMVFEQSFSFINIGFSFCMLVGVIGEITWRALL